MAEIWFKLGSAIALDTMIPNALGGTATLPNQIAGNTNGGIYLILNQSNAADNRYSGITENFQKRFAGRQGACFELGVPKTALNGVYAFLGTVWYSDANATTWTVKGSYSASNTTISLDGTNYDFEHLFIKSVQHAWPYGTVSNTQKTKTFTNQSFAHAMDIRITWNSVDWSSNVHIIKQTLNARGSLN